MVMFKIVRGIVTSAELNERVPNVTITIFKGKKKAIKIYTNQEGRFFKILFGNYIKILFECDGYNNKTYFKLPNNSVRLLENKLIGYQKKLHFYPGDKIEVFVNSSTKFNAKLYRHGLNKNLIKNLGHYEAIIQQVPDNKFVSQGLNWESIFSYELDLDLLGGLYSVYLRNEKNEDFAIPLIISDKNRILKNQQKKILVLASNTTWQSYNIWGGRSRYRNFEDEISSPYKLINRKKKNKLIRYFSSFKKRIREGENFKFWVYKKLTIKRPFTNCQLEDGDVMMNFTNHLAAGEWRILAWLEKKNIDYNLISGQDLHEEDAILNNFKAIILSTHCEYWSKKMYEHLKYAHIKKGLWIINLGGNSIYREIDFYKDGSTKCTSLSFKDSCEDETELLGVRFTLEGYGTCSGYRILEPDHWLFNGIEKDKEFGSKSLNTFLNLSFKFYNPGYPGVKNINKGEGASGWEMDKTNSRTSPEFIKIASGKNLKRGADMVIREEKGTRGGVFSASSITFGGSLLIDEVCSKITWNLLNHLKLENK